MTDISEQTAQGDESPTTFDAMPLSDDVKRALADMGYLHPTPVQFAVYGPAVARADLVVQARTGTGKTAAFGIPLVDQLITRSLQAPQALILTPTRELAMQVASELEHLAAYRNIRVATLYGGAPIQRQIDALSEGVQIIVGTPGRVLDHLRRGTLDAANFVTVVLDESDEMLSMGFEKELNAIVEALPNKHQMMLFSATLPSDIVRMAQSRLHDPQFIYLSGDSVGALEILHFVYMIMSDKSDALVRIIDVEDPESALIFCNTKDETERVAALLQRVGYDADWLNGDLPQAERQKVMAQSKAGKLRFLVATDVAARGIDISHLTHVINFDFPESSEVYVHRTGRTGRMGRTGTAISLITPHDIGALYYLRLSYKIRPFEKQLPSKGDLKTREQTDIIAMLNSAFGKQQPHPDDMALGRRLLTHDKAEVILANLLRNHLGDRMKSAEQATDERRAKSPKPIVEAKHDDMLHARGKLKADLLHVRDDNGKANQTRNDKQVGNVQRSVRAENHETQSKRIIEKAAAYDDTCVKANAKLQKLQHKGKESEKPSAPVSNDSQFVNCSKQDSSNHGDSCEPGDIAKHVENHDEIHINQGDMGAPHPDNYPQLNGSVLKPDPVTLPSPPKSCCASSTTLAASNLHNSSLAASNTLTTESSYSSTSATLQTDDDDFDDCCTLRPASYHCSEEVSRIKQEVIEPARCQQGNGSLANFQGDLTDGETLLEQPHQHGLEGDNTLSEALSNALPKEQSAGYVPDSAYLASDGQFGKHVRSYVDQGSETWKFSEEEDPTGRQRSEPPVELPRYKILLTEDDASDDDYVIPQSYMSVSDSSNQVHGERPYKREDSMHLAEPGMSASNEEQVEIFVNVGRKDGVRPGDFMSLFEKAPGLDRVQIGRIRVRERNTFISVDKSVFESAVKALHGRLLAGRIASAQLARPKGS